MKHITFLQVTYGCLCSYSSQSDMDYVTKTSLSRLQTNNMQLNNM